MTPEAPVSGSSKTPENKGAGVPFIETGEMSKKKLLALKIAAGVAITTTALVGGVGFAMNANGAKAPEATSISDTNVATPSTGQEQQGQVQPQEQQAENPLSVSALELPASLTPEQISTTIIQERYTQWLNAGFTDANYQAWLLNDESITPEGEFIRNTITNEVGDNFADAMFVSNWRDIPELKQTVDTFKNNNTAVLELLFKTKLDDTPYEIGFKVDSPVTVTSQTADTMTLSTAGSQYDNAAESRARELDPNGDIINGHTFTETTQLVLIDGTWKIEKTNAVGR